MNAATTNNRGLVQDCSKSMYGVGWHLMKILCTFIEVYFIIFYQFSELWNCCTLENWALVLKLLFSGGLGFEKWCLATPATVTSRLFLELKHQPSRLEDSGIWQQCSLYWVELLMLENTNDNIYLNCFFFSYLSFSDIFLFLQCQCKLIKRGKREVDNDGENVTTSTTWKVSPTWTTGKKWSGPANLVLHRFDLLRGRGGHSTWWVER